MKIPVEIRVRVTEWIKSIEIIGLEATRQIGGNGLHDEPLSGNRNGQRSVRLNRSWRLLYTIEKGEIKIITIVAITKHEYR